MYSESKPLQDFKASVKPQRPVLHSRGYESIVHKHLSPALGHLKLNELSAAHLQALYRSKLDSGISTSTVLSIHTVASGPLKQATRWGLVLQNVASLTTKPQLKKSEVEPLVPRGCQAAPLDR